MTWLYVPSLFAPASADSISESAEPDPTIVLWALSSGKPTVRPSSWPGWLTRPWIKLLSGTTFAPSTVLRGVAAWISSLPDSRVSPSASPANDSHKPTSAGSGPRSGGWLAEWSADTCSWRTSQGSLALGLEESSVTWPRAGGMRNGTVYPRHPSAPLTSATDCSSSPLLPTPTAQESETRTNRSPSGGAAIRPMLAGLAASGRLQPQPTARHRGGQPTPPILVVTLEQLSPTRSFARIPTPVAHDCKGSGRNGQLGTEIANMKKILPTPMASDSSRASATHKRGNPTLRGATGASGRIRLSPRFVEWMMGLPIGWTEIGPIESTHSVTPSSPKQPRKRGASCGNG